MRLWRIANALYPVWSAEGARLKGGRWNRPGTPAVYAATSFAAAVLEVLVHANTGRVPPSFRVVTADLPEGAGVDRVDAAELSGWDAMPPGASCDYGDAWLRARTGLVLLVPSVVTGGMDLNAMVNPLHPDFARIVVGEEAPVRLDPRLFPGAAG
jgi:RES domain-containing protein